MNKNKIASESLAEKCGRMAEQYDKDKETLRWNGPNVIFGLSFGYIEAGQSILDIGIGTGLGSQLFYKAGLKVYGMDISPEMLTVCEKKGIAKDLKMHDLTRTPYPYGESSINHAICVGVLNHFDNIEPIFSETSRILKNNGIFGFIVADRKSDEDAIFEVQHAGSCHKMYRHSTEQIHEYTKKAGFQILHELKFIVPEHNENNKGNILKAYVAGKSVMQYSE
jgi:predicted TPR repeat methyltransferase